MGIKARNVNELSLFFIKIAIIPLSQDEHGVKVL